MSGEILRQTAKSGSHARLRAYIKDKANPCSVDEYGLTPLMYAVWNGHIECVKLLLANDMGVNSSGHRCSSINLTSSRGYSALHLAAIDPLSWSCKEITFLLLCMHINPSLRCSENMTAEEIAVKYNNSDFLEVYNRFKYEDIHLKSDIKSCKETLHTNYTFSDKQTYHAEIWSPNFPVPSFISDCNDRIGARPSELQIHERHIKPLIKCGAEEMRGIASLRCLEFSKEQATANAARRSRLLKYSDPELEPLPLPSLERLDKVPTCFLLLWILLSMYALSYYYVISSCWYLFYPSCCLL